MQNFTEIKADTGKKLIGWWSSFGVDVWKEESVIIFFQNELFSDLTFAFLS